ncbi:MAG: spermidine synthase [Pirellulales bacterium]|nr:spermidine synthase [Pirellulales bacterium]
MRRSVIRALLFCSGLTALTVQVAWMREFRLVFGATTAASAAVVAIFMGGLGLGNALLGRRADEVKRPLRLYAGLEFGVALTAAVSPLSIDLVRAIYISLGGQSTLGFAGATLVRLALSAAVLIVPTMLMGGTLPAAVRAATSAGDEHRRGAGRLYGANTLGGVCGAVLATFMLLPSLGTRTTLWLGCSLSLLVAAAAWRLSRNENDEVEAAEKIELIKRIKKGNAALAPQIALSSRWIYLFAALVGFAFFLMELVWYRMLGPILGGTTYTFGLILAVALLGIGVGGAAYAPLFRRLRPTPRIFALSCALEALCVAFPFALGDRLALLAARCHEAAGGFSDSVFGWAVTASIVILPAAVVSGVQFPLLIALLGSGRENVGRQVGYAFAWNTVGAILGSLAGGFGALPLLSAPGTWRAVVLLLAGIAAAATAISLRRVGARKTLLQPAAAICLALFCLWSEGPTAVWRHSGIGAGRFALPSDPNALQNWINSRRRRVIWEADGVEASVALVDEVAVSFYINGKCDGDAVNDAGTQLVSGVLAAMLHPDPKTAFIVGLGTGETPGWLAEVSSIESVDVAEIEPAIDEMARRCAAVNHNVLEHPKVNRIYDDAREILLTIPKSYDLIFSEPSNPYRAGIANLFTEEFYLAARQRLNRRGLFIQWVQAYEIDAQTVAVICATLRSVFDHVEAWQSKAEDILVICSQEPLIVAIEQCRQRLAVEPFKSAFAVGWRAENLEAVLARFVAGGKTIDALRRDARAINTDDHNLIEYAFARSVGQSINFSVTDLHQTAIKLCDNRPAVDGLVDWREVDDHRQMFMALFRGEVIPPPNPTDEQKARTALFRAYWSGNSRAAAKLWAENPFPLRSSTDRAILSLVHAGLDGEKARPIIEQLRRASPLEADGIEAVALWKQRKYAAAADKLANVFMRLRCSPWIFSHVADLLFPMAVDLARRDRLYAAKIRSALDEPLAVHLHEQQRVRALCAIAPLLGPEAIIRSAQALEPNVIWEKWFLTQRAEIYSATGNPLVPVAKRDLNTFLGNEAESSLR